MKFNSLGIVLIWIALGLVFLASACSPAAPEIPPTQDPAPIYTQAAQTVVAGLTAQAPAATNTPLPTATLLPTDPPRPTSTAEPTNTAFVVPSPTNRPPTRDLIFKDNFKTDTGWFQGDSATSTFELVENGYLVTAKVTNAQIWSVRSVDPLDIILEVEVQQIAGPQDGYYGVTCRHQGDGNNYYALVIGSDGFLGIAKMEDGLFEFIAEGLDTQELISTTEETVNVIRADCLGETFTLYVNGEKVLSTQDTTFASGQIGMFVGTRLVEDEPFEARYNSFSIYSRR